MKRCACLCAVVSYSLHAQLWDLAAGKVLHSFPAHAGPVTSAQCVPNNIAVCLKSGAPVSGQRPDTRFLILPRFHPHEFLLATTGGDGSVRLWDLETFDCASEHTTPPKDAPRAAAFAPCGSALLLSGATGVTCWGWEPSRVFDTVTVPWKGVADAACASGRLLTCVTHTSFVSVHAVELSRLAPWASSASRASAETTRPCATPERAERAAQAPQWAVPDTPGSASRAAREGSEEREGEEYASPSTAAAAPPAKRSLGGSFVLSPAQLRHAMRACAVAEPPEQAHDDGEAPAAAPAPAPPARTRRSTPMLSYASVSSTSRQSDTSPAWFAEALAAHPRVSAALSLRLAHVTALRSALRSGDAPSVGDALRRAAGDEAAVADALRPGVHAHALFPAVACELAPHLVTLLTSKHSPHAAVGVATAEACAEALCSSINIRAARGALQAMLPPIQMIAETPGPLRVRAGGVRVTIEALLEAL